MISTHFSLSEADACLTLEFRERFCAAAVSAEFVRDIEDVCRAIDGDPGIRVVTLAFEGLPAFDAGSTDADPVMGVSIVDAIARISKPVICAISRGATGLGLELALACDIRISTTDSKFALTQIREGRIPYAGGTQRLPRLIGQAKALEMLLTGAPVDANDAYRIGLINQIVAPADLATAASTLAASMAAGAPLSMQLVKEAIYSGMDMTLDQGLQMELDLYLLLFSTGDRTEGISAFRDKRAPRFLGY